MKKIDNCENSTVLVALLLAFTNGFEIIRGHLRQMARPVKEVK